MSDVFSPLIGEIVEVATTNGDPDDVPKYVRARVDAVPSGNETRYHLRELSTNGTFFAKIFEMRACPPFTTKAMIELVPPRHAMSSNVRQVIQSRVHEGDLSASLIEEGAFKPLSMDLDYHRDEKPTPPMPNVRTAHRQGPPSHVTRRHGGLAEQERRADFGPNGQTLEDLASDLLVSITDASGVDAETPGRFVRALQELTSGYAIKDPVEILKTFPVEGGHADPSPSHDGGLVMVKDIPFASLCEHHVLPFTGTVAVAYIPSDRIVGLSKIPRLIRAYTRRLQVQERIGQQVGDAIQDALNPLGVMVVVRGRHTCMAIRGVETPGEMITSYVLGVFRKDPAARSEALSLLR